MVRSKQENSGNPTISFRLGGEYYQRLKQVATATNSTPSIVARSLLVSSLEQPSQEELSAELASLRAEVSSGSLEVSLVRQELAQLRASLSAGLELLLVCGGVSEEDAIAAIDPLFFEEEQGGDE